MKLLKLCLFSAIAVVTLLLTSTTQAETSSGWEKHPGSPVLGGKLGTCFDIALIQEGDTFKMWFSWRPKSSIGYTESKDGIHWSDPKIVLSPAGDWEGILNRPGVLFKDGKYHMWYTGQVVRGKISSKIGYATSTDGINWTRVQKDPVLVPELPWENVAAMCPHVLWDESEKVFKMWYSAGEFNEPNALGYATSPDGIHWTKYANNPIFQADKNTKWEQHKVTAAQIFPYKNMYYMFYIGFETESLARIGIARSKDGITNWERLKTNPIIGPDAGKWDASACYKPFAIYDKEADLWRLWYNGRNGGMEQIGLVIHKGEDLGFDAQSADQSNTDGTAWKIQPNTILTPWAENVNPNNALPEYPRPQFERADWQSLNGLWEYAIIDKDGKDNNSNLATRNSQLITLQQRPSKRTEKFSFRIRFNLPCRV